MSMTFFLNLSFPEFFCLSVNSVLFIMITLPKYLF